MQSNTLSGNTFSRRCLSAPSILNRLIIRQGKSAFFCTFERYFIVHPIRVSLLRVFCVCEFVKIDEFDAIEVIEDVLTMEVLTRNHPFQQTQFDMIGSIKIEGKCKSVLFFVF